MLADGNGDFAEALGLTMDGSKFGMGKRSQRYSMIVNDGVVEQSNVEAPGEYLGLECRNAARTAIVASILRRTAGTDGARRALHLARTIVRSNEHGHHRSKTTNRRPARSRSRDAAEPRAPPMPSLATAPARRSPSARWPAPPSPRAWRRASPPRSRASSRARKAARASPNSRATSATQRQGNRDRDVGTKVKDGLADAGTKVKRPRVEAAATGSTARRARLKSPRKR